MKFNKMFLILSTFMAVGPAAKAMDVPYYNMKSGQTTLIYVENGVVYRANCPGSQIVHSRSECDLGSKDEMFKLQDATAFFLGRLNRFVPSPVAINPLKLEEVSALLKLGTARSGFSQARVDELQKTIANMTEFLTKFEDADARSKLIAAQKEMENYTGDIRVQQDFDQLVKSFIGLVQDQNQWKELLESKSRGSLVGLLAKMIATKLYPSSCSGANGGFGDLKVGNRIQLKAGKDLSSEGRALLGQVGTVTRLGRCPDIEVQIGGKQVHGPMEYLEFAP